mgnify:CR=1 FL=1
MNKVMEVARADDVTGNPFSVAITAPDRVHFVKGTCKEVLGTANAVGCTIDGSNPISLQEASSDPAESFLRSAALFP